MSGGRLPLLLVALAATLLSCSGPQLEGSLSEAFDLSFTSTEVRQSPTAVQVSWLKSEGREIVLRVTVATEGLELTPGKALALEGEYAPGHPRTRVVRAVDGEPLRTLPDVAHGTLTLDEAPAAGKLLGGELDLSFGDGGDVGAGRNVHGRFSGTVVAVP